jgi:hypothetical protein
MKPMKLAHVRHLKVERSLPLLKTLEEARAVVGNQPRTCIHNMAVALSLHTHRNTAEDWRRLEAALMVLAKR